MKLSQEQFNQRCHEVFMSFYGDEYYTIKVKDNEVIIQMSEVDSPETIFEYKPNMSERPEALQYLMGERNSFSD